MNLRQVSVFWPRPSVTSLWRVSRSHLNFWNTPCGFWHLDIDYVFQHPPSPIWLRILGSYQNRANAKTKSAWNICRHADSTAEPCLPQVFWIYIYYLKKNSNFNGKCCSLCLLASTEHRRSDKKKLEKTRSDVSFWEHCVCLSVTSLYNPHYRCLMWVYFWG